MMNYIIYYCNLRIQELKTVSVWRFNTTSALYHARCHVHGHVLIVYSTLPFWPSPRSHMLLKNRTYEIVRQSTTRLSCLSYLKGWSYQVTRKGPHLLHADSPLVSPMTQYLVLFCSPSLLNLLVRSYPYTGSHLLMQTMFDSFGPFLPQVHMFLHCISPHRCIPSAGFL